MELLWRWLIPCNGHLKHLLQSNLKGISIPTAVLRQRGFHCYVKRIRKSESHGMARSVQVICSCNAAYHNKPREFNPFTHKNVSCSTPYDRLMSKANLCTLLRESCSSCTKKHGDCRTQLYSTSSNSYDEHIRQPVDQDTSKTVDAAALNNIEIKNDPLVLQLCQCSTSEEILDIVKSAQDTNSLETKHLSTVFTRLQLTVYDQLSFSWLLPDHKLRRKQLSANFLVQQVFGSLTSDSRFQDLLTFTETQLNILSARDCLSVLHTLGFFFFQKESSLLTSLLSRCINSIEQFSMSDLAKLSSCLESSPWDFTTQGRLANTVKTILTTPELIPDTDLGDLCQVLENIKHIVSKDLFELAAETALVKLKQEIPNISLITLGQLCRFSEVSSYECTESLVNGVLKIPQMCFENVRIDNDCLIFDVCSAIGKNPWLCSVIHRVRAECKAELLQNDDLSAQDIVRLSLPLDEMPDIVQVYADCVINCDNFLLFQLMSHHLHIDLVKRQGSKGLLYAYQERLRRLLVESTNAQLEELLWENEGERADVLFNFKTKMASLQVYPNPTTKQQLKRLLVLPTGSWDVPETKIKLAMVQAVYKLRTDFFPMSQIYHSLSKLLVRLSFDGLMYTYNELDNLTLNRSLPKAAMNEAKSLQEQLKLLFLDKLSRTHELTPALTTHKIWHRWGLRKTTKNGLFGHLIDNLPRFITNGDDKNYLRALRILYWSSEKIPFYLEDTFENLIKYLIQDTELHAHPWIQLIKILAYAGYQPRDMAVFEEFTSRLMEGLLEHNYVYKSMQVQLAYHLSMMGIFYDRFLMRIFSLDFIMELEREFEDTAPHKTQVIKSGLATLSRSVSIQCPHLAVSWIAQKLLPKSERYALNTRLIRSLIRISGGERFVQIPGQSPYQHNIGAVVYLDHNMVPVDWRKMSRDEIVNTSCERLALLFLDCDVFCHDSDHMTGRCRCDIQELQMLGYLVVTVSDQELSASDCLDDPGLDKFLCRKINVIAGCELFPDLSEFSEIFDN